jgi:hypothetical protein
MCVHLTASFLVRLADLQEIQARAGALQGAVWHFGALRASELNRAG